MAVVPRIVLAGGVSGGHTFPLIAVARALREEFPGGVEFLFIGSGGRFEDSSLEKEGIPIRYVFSGKMRRYFSWRNLIDPFKVPLGVLQSLWHLFRFMPDAVFAKGASGSVPVVIAAWVYRIPVVIHDSDAVAGRATRFLGRFAKRVAIAYPSAHAFFPAEKTALVGNPVREEVLQGDKEEAMRRFALEDKPTVLFFGGSLGSRTINEAALPLIPKLLGAGYQVIHQTGQENHQAFLKDLVALGIEKGKGYHAQAFFQADELADAFALATVVVSRAGANALSEFAALKKACILVPLATAANDEQRANAYEIAKIGGAVVMEEANLGENMLYHKITELLGDETLRNKMGENFAQFYHPHAARDIAQGIKGLIHDDR